MLEGRVTDLGVPVVELTLAGEVWLAIVDTGFNGYLELPLRLADRIKSVHRGTSIAVLASGQTVALETYLTEVIFDGVRVSAEVTFADIDFILIGGALLKAHRLAVNYPTGDVRLERVAKG